MVPASGQHWTDETVRVHANEARKTISFRHVKAKYSDETGRFARGCANAMPTRVNPNYGRDVPRSELRAKKAAAWLKRAYGSGNLKLCIRFDEGRALKDSREQDEGEEGQG